ncbi:dihydrodipicolinate synthase family protein [Burkholderia sp. WAC0059]|uniref:dihydrodipicolinate synthase family protein n=1 Tax=Burkholderia sp. WAC0059 TaxID=2066022 RepID=UPI000C7F735D|nr:dihydrodipicolinate synthase family protein [Burkholderia sp. WAC0059]PLZ02668.1 dihydrodipicolinate synthase family protein [Burkholderia sp. WAC0059]
MKTSVVTREDLCRSVIAVPPLARNGDLTVNHAQNRALIRHMEAGGVGTLLYGGNANFYHVGVDEYAGLLDFLGEAVRDDTWVIPSIGPDYGRAQDQLRILRSRAFPTAMLLPIGFPYTDAGVADGVRRLTDAFGKPLVLYVKKDGYIEAQTLQRLAEEGRVAAVKYAVVRETPEVDPYLRSLISAVGADRIVSGIGERPAISHLRDFGLAGFTSGSVCIAPRGSTRLLALLKARRYDDAETLRSRYLPMEDARDSINPIRVLHDAVSLAGIADMGPILPMLTNLSEDDRRAVEPVARRLLEQDNALER